MREIPNGNPEWRTPPPLFRLLERHYGAFDLDPATTADNPLKTATFYTEAEDGLAQLWHGNVFVNPPYGSALPHWVKKAISEHRVGRTKRIVMLLPSRTDTKWFCDLLWREVDEIRFMRGRVVFEPAFKNEGRDEPTGLLLPASPMFPSLIAVFGVRTFTFTAPRTRVWDWRKELPLANRSTLLPVQRAGESA